jgi:hypothetical protein
MTALTRHELAKITGGVWDWVRNAANNAAYYRGYASGSVDSWFDAGPQQDAVSFDKQLERNSSGTDMFYYQGMGNAHRYWLKPSTQPPARNLFQ